MVLRGDRASQVGNTLCECNALASYDEQADRTLFQIADIGRPIHVDVDLLFVGKPTDVTETSPNIDLTTLEPTPSSAMKLVSKTRIACGDTGFGSSNDADGTTLFGQNRFSLTFSSLEDGATASHPLVPHGKLHVDCAAAQNQAGVVMLDVEF